MPRSLFGPQVRGQTQTHEGAAQFAVDDPLLHLVFTKSALTFQRGFYQSQADELRGFMQALVAANRHEPGFGWRYATWMRDPKRGKGNRIAGTVALATLCANFPEEQGLAVTYIPRVLAHRPDDVVQFLAHFENLGLMRLRKLPVWVRAPVAQALAAFDDYQLYKYRSLRFARPGVRANGKAGSIRLADALGLCKRHLDERTRGVWAYLRSTTRRRRELQGLWPFAEALTQRLRGRDAGLIGKHRIPVAAALSMFGNRRATWDALLNAGLVPDLGFMLNIRNMALAGFTPENLGAVAEGRRFAGIWPHQVLAAYRAVWEGQGFGGKKAGKMSGHAEVFETILARIVEDLLPTVRSLGFADISASMDTRLSPKGTATLADASRALCAALATTSGYAATFSDRGFIAAARDYRGPLNLVLEAPEMNQGWGATQVYGAVMDALQYVQKRRIEPFRALWFFSDMQFHPPNAGDARQPPLVLALQRWTEALGGEPPLVVLWNLASYDGAPLQVDYPGVAFVSGFDANVFQSLKEWFAAGGRTVSVSRVTGKQETMAELLDLIRGL